MSAGIGGTNAIVNIFNFKSDDSEGLFSPGALNHVPSYLVVETGQYKAYANVTMDVTMASGNSISWSLQMYSGSTLIQSDTQQAYFGDIPTTCNEWAISETSADNLLWYTRTDCTTGATIGPSKVNIGATIIVCSRYAPQITYGQGEVIQQITTCGTYYEPGTLNQVLTFNIDRGYGNTNYISSTSGNNFKFQLKLNGITNSNYTASLRSTDNLKIGALAISTGYSVIGYSYINNVGTSSITLDQELSSFYNKGYLFSPNPLIGSINSLYETYGDVDYTFAPKANDIVLLYLSSDESILEYTILNVDSSTGKLVLNLDSPLSDIAKTELASSILKRFLILSRIDDETSVILNFIKRTGKTSYGFLIPENISRAVLANIDTITKETKQKLLGEQSIINDINGGTFG
jgi:hypothetical protein